MESSEIDVSDTGFFSLSSDLIYEMNLSLWQVEIFITSILQRLSFHSVDWILWHRDVLTFNASKIPPSFFCWWISIFSASWLLRLSLPFCVSCGYILVDIPYIYRKNYFWVLCSVQLVYLSVFIPVPHHLDYLVIDVEIERPPSSFFKSFAVCSLNRSMNFTMFYSASIKIILAVLIMN